MKTHLLIIDPQEDFCNQGGNLYVPGAEVDMGRVALDIITRLQGELADIHVTLDNHHFIDVAHPAMWRDVDENMPNPFTIISSAEVKDGVWKPFHPGLTKRMVDYTDALESGGRYPLCIWPPHCLIGSPGASIVSDVRDALNKWSVAKGATVDFVAKGTNPFTEHYSAVKAEVPDPKDPSTKLNTTLIQTLEEADMIILMGEAGSHCLANTVMDIADGFSDQSFIKKLVLITDGTSPVPGFENLQDDFINKMTAKGMQLATAKEILS